MFTKLQKFRKHSFNFNTTPLKTKIACPIVKNNQTSYLLKLRFLI